MGHCTADIQDTVLTTETSLGETVGDKGMLGNDEMSDWALCWGNRGAGGEMNTVTWVETTLDLEGTKRPLL